MGYLVRKCIRCGVVAQLDAKAITGTGSLDYELFMVCNVCRKGSIYEGQPREDPLRPGLNLVDTNRYFSDDPIFIVPESFSLSEDIPERIRDLFDQAAKCRQLGAFDASGAMFRKTIDVSTRVIYSINPKLFGRNPADAARARIKALHDLGVIEEDIWELADVALVDGNDATHDIDPYTAGEAEALEELTKDLLDRLFVRPARVARVKEKQVASGVRKT